MMPTQRNLEPLLIILVVLLFAVGGYWFKEGKLLAKLSFGTTPKTFDLKVEATEGALIDGFPEGYVSLVSDAQVLESALYESDNAEVRRVIYRTAAGIPDLFAAYINHFTDRGFSFSDIRSGGGITGMAAEYGAVEVKVDMYLSSSRTTDVRIDVLKPVIQ